MSGAVIIRPAAEAEARACRMLLPAMFGVDQVPELLVATVPGSGEPRQGGPSLGGPRLAGALGLATVRSPRDGSFAVGVQVVPPLRRQGIGRALVAAAVERARGRAPVLRAVLPVSAESDAASFLLATGFDGREVIRHFAVEGEAFHAHVAAIRARLERAGRVPAAAAAVRLRDAPAEAVARLVARFFPVPAAAVLARLRPGAADGYDLEHSAVLLLDGAVRGALLYEWRGAEPSIEVNVVDPALRGGWANVLLLERATWHGLQAAASGTKPGARRFRFSADERVGDTMGLARRTGAVPLQVEWHCWRRLDPA